MFTPFPMIKIGWSYLKVDEVDRTLADLVGKWQQLWESFWYIFRRGIEDIMINKEKERREEACMHVYA